MKLVELKNSNPSDSRPYITISQGIIFINAGTTKHLQLRDGMGMNVGKGEDDPNQFFLHFTEIAAVGAYELKRQHGKALALVCSCAGKAVKEGLQRGKHYLGDFVVKKNADSGEDIILYPLEHAGDLTAEETPEATGDSAQEDTQA